MKRTLLFITCVLAALTMSAQEEQNGYRPIVEDGKHWTYDDFMPLRPAEYDHYYYYDLKGDTLIAGKNCLKMYCENRANNNIVGYYAALYEENKKVYCFYSGKEEAALIYDFDCEVGDTIQVKEGQMVLKDIRTEDNGGIVIRKYILQAFFDDKENYGEICWIEGVGATRDFFSMLALPGNYSRLNACEVNGEKLYQWIEPDYTDEGYRKMGIEGKRWNYIHYYVDENGEHCDPYSYVVKGDTIIRRTTYKKLWYQDEKTERLVCLLFEQGREIQKSIDFGDNSYDMPIMRQLFDFGRKDFGRVFTWKSEVNSGNTNWMVYGVDTIEVKGLPFRRYTCLQKYSKEGETLTTIEYDGEGVWHDIWVEGIGSATSGIEYQNPNAEPPVRTSNDFTYFVSCYEDGKCIFTAEDFNVQSPNGVAIDESHFPDPAFREWLEQHFTPEEIPTAKTLPFSAVQYSNRYENRIASLAGLEYFTSLEALDLVSFIKLSSLDLSGNKKLRRFSYIMEYNNTIRLSSLNLTGAVGLGKLRIENSDLTSLDLSGNAGLKTVEVTLSPSLTTLDLSGCQVIETVVAGWGRLRSLRLPDGADRLTSVNVMYNGLGGGDMDAFLESLPNVSNAPLLIVNSRANRYAGVTEGDNRMTAGQAAVATAKGWLVRYRDEQGVLQGPETPEEAGLVDIDEQSFPDTHFRSWVSRNFKSFTLPMQYSLHYDPSDHSSQWPHAEGDDLVESFEGLEHFTVLKSFNVRNLNDEKSVAEFDVSKCKNLQSLSLSYLPCLRVLDVSGAEKLTSLEVIYCPLESLKFPQNGSLRRVYLVESMPMGEAASNFLEGLPLVFNAPLLVIDGDNCRLTEAQAAIAVGKGWRIQYTDESGQRRDEVNDNTQPYHPFVEDGKVWKVGAEGSGNPVQWVEHFYFDGDTIIDGKTCKQMMRQRYVNPDFAESNFISQEHSLSYVGAWCEENKKVYIYDSTNNLFKLMYDFSIEANNTLQIDNQPYVVGPRLTEGIIGFKGVYRNVVMPGDGESVRSTPWLEGVGGIYGPTINVFDSQLGDPAWFLMSCTVGDEVIYLNDDYEDGATPEGMNARKRFDFTHTIKTKPKAPASSLVRPLDACKARTPLQRARGTLGARAISSAEAEQSLYGEYNNLLLDIHLDPLDDAYQVRIADETGEAVYEKTVNAGTIVGLNIDISAYAEGRYTVTVENSSEAFVGQFEVQTMGIEENVKIEKLKNESIYNLQGQRFSTLQKGLNIVNGRKVSVK